MTSTRGTLESVFITGLCRDCLRRSPLPVAGGVAAGTGSAYTEVTPGTTIDLSATAVGLASPVYTAVDRTLASGGVYTVFVLGGPSPATGVLRQDR